MEGAQVLEAADAERDLVDQMRILRARAPAHERDLVIDRRRVRAQEDDPGAPVLLRDLHSHDVAIERDHALEVAHVDPDVSEPLHSRHRRLPWRARFWSCGRPIEYSDRCPGMRSLSSMPGHRGDNPGAGRRFRGPPRCDLPRESHPPSRPRSVALAVPVVAPLWGWRVGDMFAARGTWRWSPRRARRLAVWLALLCALGAPASSSAQSAKPPSAASARCENAFTTAAMRECELERYKQADAAMTAAYEALMGQLDQTGKAKLRSAQRAWIKFRDAESDLQADAARGGTLAP